MTIFRGMVLIGSTAVWLWLLRINVAVIVAGSVVLLLMLIAAHRRGMLAVEVKDRKAAPSQLARAGFAGYTIAVILALLWVVAIAVWDSYEQRSRKTAPLFEIRADSPP